MTKNKKTRIFIGIDLPNHIKKEISKKQKCLDSTPSRIKWVKKNNLHITLKFLGYINNAEIKNISNVVKKATLEIKEFEICLTKIGVFPKINYPKIIWVGTENKTVKLQILFKSIEKQLQQIGFDKEKRKFHPHVTIGRIKKLQKKSKLINLLENIKYPNQFLKIKKVTLYKSNLTPTGPVYTKLDNYNLRN